MTLARDYPAVHVATAQPRGGVAWGETLKDIILTQMLGNRAPWALLLRSEGAKQALLILGSWIPLTPTSAATAALKRNPTGESEQRERFSKEKMSHRRNERGGSVILGLYLSCDSTLKARPGRISLSHKSFASFVHSVTSTGCTGKIKCDYCLIIMRSVQPGISNNPTWCIKNTY